jgi:hypothetical protein
MSTPTKVFSTIAALFVAFVGSAQAQLQTYQTQTAYQGSAFTFYGNTLGQTFTNVSAVKSMTYNFFAGSGGATTAVSLTATFGEWNGSSFVSGTTVSFGTINIPASTSGWTTFTNSYGTFNTYAYEFDLAALSSSLTNATYGYLTDSSSTYALMLTDNTGGGNGLALGLTNTNAFAYGATNLNFNDWVFAQIVVAPGSQTLTPVPESGTIAAYATGLLVLGMVGYRVRQRRATAAIPTALAA